MDMEIDEANNRNSLFVCFITKKAGLKRTKVDLTELTLDVLRSSVDQELNRWEWNDATDKPHNFELLHQSRTLRTDEDVKRIRPLSVISVVKKEIEDSASSEENHKSAKFIAEYAASRNINDQLKSCSIALRTAFLNPKFIPMVENLGDSEMLENILAIVPELKTDPVAVGIIQDPSLIFHLSDPDSLKKLAGVKPWVIEAFNFIAASIHQEKGNNPPQGIPPHLFNAAMFDGDEDAMDEDDDDDASPRGSVSRITREQLAAALSALGGVSGSASPGLPSSNAFGGLFQSAGANPPPAPTATSRPNPGGSSAGANIQNLMNTLSGAGGGVPGQPLSGDMVARAVTDALRRLTPEQRADQLNAIRTLATQLQQSASGSTSSGSSGQSVPAVPQTQPAAAGNPSLRQQYESQLRQMRDLGITDERMSLLALRVSEGDVNTAAELLFSGWQGEGSDPVD